MARKVIRINTQELACDKYSNLRCLRQLEQCSTCCIMELRKEVYSIYTLSANGDMLPLFATFIYDKDVVYYMPHMQKSRKNDPIYYFSVEGCYAQGVQELAGMIRQVNTTCTILAGTAGGALLVTKY